MASHTRGQPPGRQQLLLRELLALQAIKNTADKHQAIQRALVLRHVTRQVIHPGMFKEFTHHAGGSRAGEAERG